MFPSQQILQLRTTADLPGAQDIPAMENRNLVLEALYELDWRHSQTHPLHGTYTGLLEKYAA